MSADQRLIAMVAGCRTATALAAITMINSVDGLRLALDREQAGQARSAVIEALRHRLADVYRGDNTHAPTTD